MPDTYKKLYQGQAASSATTIYTVPGSTSAIVKHIRIVNTDTVTRWVKLWQSGTADANVILPAVALGAGEWMEFEGTILMAAADTLAAQGEVASEITITAYGLEIT